MMSKSTQDIYLSFSFFPRGLIMLQHIVKVKMLSYYKENHFIDFPFCLFWVVRSLFFFLLLFLKRIISVFLSLI
uniref:Uncharacterized protein n=1 Tax=Cannabis sativa TaxID=3483 RepID=A0A803R285_CANSA